MKNTGFPLIRLLLSFVLLAISGWQASSQSYGLAVFNFGMFISLQLLCLSDVMERGSK